MADTQVLSAPTQRFFQHLFFCSTDAQALKPENEMDVSVGLLVGLSVEIFSIEWMKWLSPKQKRATFSI